MTNYPVFSHMLIGIFPDLSFHIDDSNPCDGVASGTYLPNPLDCSKFYICNHNAAVDQTCGAGQYWDTSCSCCNHANLVDCQQGEILDTVPNSCFLFTLRFCFSAAIGIFLPLVRE